MSNFPFLMPNIGNLILFPFFFDQSCWAFINFICPSKESVFGFVDFFFHMVIFYFIISSIIVVIIIILGGNFISCSFCSFLR